MQKYKEINGNDYVKNSRTTINETMQSIQSMNSGTAFPTNNLFEGMKCYRTDLKKTYTLTDVENNTWVEDAHATLSDEATHAASATKLQTARSLNLGGAVTADAATFDGTANATINVKTLDATKLKGTASVSTTGNAATATKVVATAAAGASANIAEATMASSDYARIRVSGNDNAGELALETAADGSEPIVARQYTGAYTNAVRTAKILDESGNTSFPGTVVAPKFTGALNGNAATASKLLTPRTISLTGKAAGSTSFDGSSNASINVINVNADTASKLSSARKINITGNASGAANFDGSGDISINTTVSNSAAANKLNNLGTTSPLASGEAPANGLTVFQNYANNKFPGNYGNVVRIGGLGQNELYLDWEDGGRGNSHIYAHSRRDTDKNWTDWKVLAYTSDINNYAPTKTGGGASGTWGINISGNAASATNADKVDGVHAASLFYNKGDWASDNWATIGTYQVNNNPPVSDAYKWGQVISSSTNNARFQLYASHALNGTGRLHYRTGWDGDNRQPWNTILDSENYNFFAPTKTGAGASGTWGINISGNAKTATTASSVAWSGVTDKPGTYPPSAHNHDSAYPSVTGTRASGTWGINISGNAASATNADKVDGYHASDIISKIQDITPKTAAAIGQFRELVVNGSHQVKLPDGGTWAYFVYTYNSWSGDNSNDEHRTRTGAGIAAGGTVLHTDGSITSNTINAFKLSGTTGADGADGNTIIVGGFCWRIA